MLMINWKPDLSSSNPTHALEKTGLLLPFRTTQLLISRMIRHHIEIGPIVVLKYRLCGMR